MLKLETSKAPEQHDAILNYDILTEDQHSQVEVRTFKQQQLRPLVAPEPLAPPRLPPMLHALHVDALHAASVVVTYDPAARRYTAGFPVQERQVATHANVGTYFEDELDPAAYEKYYAQDFRIGDEVILKSGEIPPGMSHLLKPTGLKLFEPPSG